MRVSVSDQVSTNPMIAASENVVHVVWQELSPQGLGIRYRRSTDYGQTWGETQEISQPTAPDSSSTPHVATSGSNVHVMWARGASGGPVTYEYRRSTNRGESWGSVVALAEKTSIDVYDAFLDHSLWAADGMVHALYANWSAEGAFTLEHRRSIDDGASWEPARTVATLTHPDTIGPRTALGWRVPFVVGGDSTVHATWSDLLPYYLPSGVVGYYHTLMYARSIDGGASWQVAQAFGADTLDGPYPHALSALRPNLVTTSSATHIIGHATSGGTNLFYLRNPTGNLLSTVSRPGPMAVGTWHAQPQVFSAETRIRFELDRPSLVTVSLFDSRGNLVAQPIARSWINQAAEAVWNGMLTDGTPAPSGQYFYRIDAGSATAVGSVILVR